MPLVGPPPARWSERLGAERNSGLPLRLPEQVNVPQRQTLLRGFSRNRECDRSPSKPGLEGFAEP